MGDAGIDEVGRERVGACSAPSCHHMASCGHLTPRPHACSALSHGSYCLHCNLPPARPGERRHARLHDTASVRVLTAREDE